MNQPIPPLDSLASWKLRLLEKIQNTAADHARALRSGYPRYAPHDGSGDIKIQNWRAHLLILEADRHEIELRARAVGVPNEVIEMVREAGEWGQRWGESRHAPPRVREGEDRVRAYMVEGIAADVWQLEHMAVIAVEHHRRDHDSRFPHDPAGTAQFERNMAALWDRAAAAADVVELSSAEAAEMWMRDQQGWRHLVAVTVSGYSDAALHERWRCYTWRGLEHDARRGVEDLSLSIGTDSHGPRPPRPEILLERAHDALALESGGRRADGQVEAAGSAEPDATWIHDRLSDLDAPNAALGHGVDRDM